MSISLYDRALSVEQPPQALLVSHNTLTSIVKSIIDLLIEQKILATLWIKCPPGETWQAEIQRYYQEIGGASHVKTYNFYTDLQESTSKIAKTSSGYINSVIPVQLVATSPVRHEYFLLVSSAKFCCLILAHQPTSKQQETRKTTNYKDNQPLQVICSFEGQVIQLVVNSIKNEVTSARDWNFQSPSATDSVLLSQILNKQIQQQDQLQGKDNIRVTATNKTKTLKQQNQELLNTIRAKDNFFSDVCQELRTPLAHMKMALTLLNSPQLKPVQRQRYLQMLNTECDRQNSLITGLLDLMQLDRSAEQTKLQPVSLSDIVPGVVSTYQPLAQEKGIMLAYTVPRELPAVLCLSPWLKQIVINLLHNSIKFTPTGGQVWVRSRRQGDYVQLEFTDTGIGIPPHEIPKVFDHFYRIRLAGSEDSSGAGLGLTIVQQLLLRCGGSISVSSKLGEGSTFKVLMLVDNTSVQ